MPAARRYSKLFRGLTSRIAVAFVVLLISGLMAATLVRMAPGFGMDERMLDARLASSSLQAIERQGTEHSNILRYYAEYLQQSRGVRNSRFWPAGEELLSERLALSLGSVVTGLGLAWMLALMTVTVLELSHRSVNEARFARARPLVYSGRFGGAGLRLHRRHPGGGDCGNRISADLPYVRDVSDRRAPRHVCWPTVGLASWHPRAAVRRFSRTARVGRHFREHGAGLDGSGGSPVRLARRGSTGLAGCDGARFARAGQCDIATGLFHYWSESAGGHGSFRPRSAGLICKDPPPSS
jgi:hypothetical protein